MKKSVKSIAVLVSICAVVSVILALTNAITAPIITQNEEMAANAALLEVLPDGGSFERADTTAYTLPATVSDVYLASSGGHVVRLTTTGYASGMVLMCGINPDGTVAGTKLIASSETPSIGGAAAESFASLLPGRSLADIDGVDTVSGATKTTAAYRSAVRDALNTVVILGGGSVDLRTDEEILADALNEALGAANGAFTKHFFTEVTEGVDAIYFADNGAGAVCVIGEQFIALDASYTVITACDNTVADTAKTAVDTVRASAVTALDLAAYEGLPTHLVKAEKTATGNYVMEIKAAGYGITGGNEYHPASGEYIHILVSLTADGRIIDCMTLSQAETDGIGSACADEAFYGQFDGKTEETYNSIDAISGATLTTDGYKKAILRAFECVRIFEGGDPS
ncbi:MAG: FMN-binding protein [Ruminococcaceae bacterium]|nr:FMN-binding protein [Oscillospiraceae bacterium]